MKHIKLFEENSAIEKLRTVKTVALKGTFESPKPDSIDIKEGFFLLKKAILELADKVKNIEDHAAGHEDM